MQDISQNAGPRNGDNVLSFSTESKEGEVYRC